MAVDMVSVGQVGDAVTGAVCVVAVVVTYNPDPETFGRLLAASSREVTAIVVVDNGSSQVNVEELCEPDVGVPVEYLPRTSNVGIASAQNCGIAKARILQATHVLLLDHDSIPQSGMVRALIEADKDLRSKGIPVAAVGATPFDRRTGTRSKVIRMGKTGVQRLEWTGDEKYLEADFLISSGTLISLEALDRCGGMNEAYFIDHVDTEWCFRARSLGLRLFAVRGALLEHSLGDDVVRVWFGRWREVPVHSPVRDYYMFRNTVCMLLDTPMSGAWRFTHVYRLCLFAVFFCFGMRPRKERAKLMLKGILDGLARRGGPLVRAG